MSLLLYVAWCVLWPGAFLLIYFPFSVLIHELGHASAGLLLTPHHVQIRIGDGPLVWSWRRGRLELRFHRAANPHRILFWDVLNATSGGVCLPSSPPQRWRLALFGLAGPGASLLLSAACARLALAVGFATPWTFPVAGVCAVSAVVAGSEALLNLVPWRPLLSVGEGKRSDGLVIFHALFAPGQPRKGAAAPVFSDATIRALEGARDAARKAGRAHVATEHVLLALLDGPCRQVCEAVAALGDVERVRELVAATETVEPDGTTAFTIHVEASIIEAARAATSMGHGRIGPLDLVLGLATHGAGNAAAVLAACGVTADALRQYVQRSPEAEGPSPALY